ncbi:hypothetical protein B0T17DRAFT_619960 [Bombardia bombarda]|uniref:Zn(2)-C6 fungal-type domain-containing protein n=1 Tax=Bombardia bombarda TaxID=252184 RepID=A0AA40BVI0_9PEZI|nr:hypothetical protein B0T17DRAFT_619960 [Bombardia bombarda]
MVGVPGRSKGCNTCRKRKKGCDFLRPACRQCLKAGLSCAGYERPRTFVNTTGPGSHAYTAVAATRTTNINTTITLPDSLARAAYEDRYIAMFWDAYIPLGRDIEPYQAFVNPSWPKVAQNLYPYHAVLRKAVLALGLSTIGRRDRQQWMVHEGLAFYACALKDMLGELRRPERWRSDALLASSEILSLYEILYGKDDGNDSHSLSQVQSWLSHNMGTMALLLQRPPEMHTEGNANHIFHSVRMHLAISCLKMRRRCPLSSHQWKTIPFIHITKTPKDALLDIFVDCPGMLQDLDLVSAPSNGDKLKMADLLGECWRLDGELTRWLDHHAIPEKLDRIQVAAIANPPTAREIVAVKVMTLYWTMCILVYSTLRQAVPECQLDTLPPRTEPRQYCRNIANVIEVLFHPIAGMFGMHCTPLPILTVISYLDSVDSSSRGSTTAANYDVTFDGGHNIEPHLCSTEEVVLNAGGRKYTTTVGTLVDRSEFFASLSSGRWAIPKNEDGSIFVDADPDIFEYVLRYLRRGVFPLAFNRETGHDYKL